MQKEVEVSKKCPLTLEEAASCIGIGINKLRVISYEESCNFVLWNGTCHMLKRSYGKSFYNKLADRKFVRKK